MKIILLFLLVLLFFNCKCYETSTKEYEWDLPEFAKAKNLEEYNAKEPQYSLIVFRNFYEGEMITVKNGGKIIFKDSLRTIKNFGFAEMLKVNNTQSIIIYDAHLRRRIKIDKELAKKYKYINVNKLIFIQDASGFDSIRHKRPYKIRYTNTFRGFM